MHVPARVTDTAVAIRVTNATTLTNADRGNTIQSTTRKCYGTPRSVIYYAKILSDGILIKY